MDQPSEVTVRTEKKLRSEVKGKETGRGRHDQSTDPRNDEISVSARSVGS